MEERLIYDVPLTPGAAAVIARARQMHGLKWSTARPMSLNKRNYLFHDEENGEEPHEYVNVPYSSARVLDKFIGIDIRIETFLTAMRNPFSVLYRSNIGEFDNDYYHPQIANAFLHYGIVCSAFVNYALDLKFHQSTHEWWKSPYFIRLPGQNADSLMLCDTLVTTKPDETSGGHVRIVTGIGRDATGHVKEIEISESVVPFTICKKYTPEQFQSFLDSKNDRYRIYRCLILEDAKYTPHKYENGKAYNDDLMIDYGEYSNYPHGEPIEFTMSEGVESLTVIGGGDTIKVDRKAMTTEQYRGKTYLRYTLPAPKTGAYRAYATIGEKRTEDVEFNVVKVPNLTISHADGTQLSLGRYTLCDRDGSKLTRDSKCLYSTEGSHLEKALIAVTDGEHILPANVALTERDGDIVFRTSMMWLGADGRSVKYVKLSEADKTGLYAFKAFEGEKLNIKYTDPEECEISHVALKNEAIITYSQHFLTEDEAAAHAFTVKAESYKGPLNHALVISKNRFGRMDSEHIPIVVY